MKKITVLNLATLLTLTISGFATATNEAQLKAAIKDVNDGRIPSVKITADMYFSDSLHPLNIQSNLAPVQAPILIDGNHHTLKATSDHARGFFAIGHEQGNTITIRDLTIDSAVAKGGSGQDGGGGGGGGGLLGHGGDAGSFSGGGGGGLVDCGNDGSGVKGGNGGHSSTKKDLGIGGAIDTCGTDGIYGMGGGGCGRLDTHGGSGGNGGFGGGGGGDSFAGVTGKGGYGGGGGDYHNSKGGAGGTGGFGGGGGAGGPNGGTGGLGIFGGRGSNSGGLGGGGAAMGGAIFIEKEGHLVIKDKTSFTSSSLQGGTGFVEGETLGTDIFMMSGGKITWDLQQDVTVPTPIESDFGSDKSGGLIKHGPAILTLTDANTYTGKTEVKKGTLLLNGSVETPIILHGGTLGGEATALSDVNNHLGVLTNSYGEVHVKGDYSQGSDGTYLVRLGYDDTPMLHVNGTAFLDGTLQIGSPDKPFEAGTEFEILSANKGLVGEFSSIKMAYSPYGTPLFKLGYSSNQLVLTAQPFNFISRDSVKSGNPKKTLDYICSLFPLTPNSDLSLVVNSLAFLSPEELSKALDQLNPALYGSIEWMNLNQTTAIFSMVTNHLTHYNCPPTGICRDSLNHVWFEPYGYWNEYGKLNHIRGFDSDEIGFVLGYDRRIQDFFIGVLGGYSYTELHYDQDSGGGNYHSVFGGLYGTYLAPFHLAVDTAVILGGNFYDLDRRIHYGDGNITRTISRSAKSDHNAFTFGAHFGLNYDFEQFSAPVGLLASVDYSYLNQDQFQESGADSLNLVVSDQVSNMLQTELGAYFAKVFIFKTRCVTPYLGLSWIVKIPLSDGDILAHFRGQDKSFRVDTTNEAVQFVAPKAAIKFSTKKCFAFTLEAFAELSGQYKSYFFGGRFEKKF
ncbi:autotransporter domain-containing protein [Simkania sp.]|uniref:autotransporter domain-containing protein n=1 Tax=Simkania sp. TaxID=34094 RepID=UPI003B5244ED